MHKIMSADSVRVLVDRWMSEDFNEETRSEISSLVSSNSEDKLRGLLEKRLVFGTAGLRGVMCAGYNAMNTLVILQTSQGLCEYLKTQFPLEELKSRGIIIGCDARYHSREFSHITAAVFLSEGISVKYFKGHTSTPMVPFGLSLFNCVAGVMVTASHNPKQDNGFKVYWENGAQIIPPHDDGIAKCIEQNFTPWKHVPAKEAMSWGDIPPMKGCLDVTHDVESAYFKRIVEKCCMYSDMNPDARRVVFTAMHGVGYPFIRQAFDSFNLPPVIPVEEQVLPDPSFPTVSFPNPEEGKSALNLAIRTAEENKIPLILANDPDADRLAIAELNEETGKWKIFNGNEIALLFADYVWSNHVTNLTSEEKKNCVMIASTVSSKILDSMSKHEGFTFVDTLTGFKWMGNKASDLIAKGMTVLLAFEVEIGFVIHDVSLDKDGIRAAACMAEQANFLYKKYGTSLQKRLEQLYEKYGYHEMLMKYFFCYDPSVMMKIFDRMREGGYPKTLGGVRITRIRDLTVGYDNGEPENKPTLPVSADSQMITFWLENGATITLRGSGTEPKLKYYVECVDKDERLKARKLCDDTFKSVVDELLQPERNGLVPPKVE